MTFREEFEQLRRENRQRKFPSSVERYDERWSMLDKFKKPSSAAGLEKAVTEFLILKGHSASKTEVKGTFIQGEEYKTATGHKIRGQGKFITSGARKGQADISSSIYGIAVHWEVKFSPKDRQSPEQKVFEKEVISSGGFYFIIRTIEDFYEKYNNLISHPQIVLLKSYHEQNKNE